MKSFLMTITLVAAFATLVALVWGLFNLLRKNHSSKKSNDLMRWRVILQVVALAVFSLFLLIGKS